ARHTPLVPRLRRPPPHATLFPYTTLFRSARRSATRMSEPRHRRTRAVSRRRILRMLGAGPVARALARLPWLSAVSGLALSGQPRSEEHTSELQSLRHLVCRLLLEKKNCGLRSDRLRLTESWRCGEPHGPGCQPGHRSLGRCHGPRRAAGLVL